MWKVSAPSARARARQGSDLAGVISYPPSPVLVIGRCKSGFCAPWVRSDISLGPGGLDRLNARDNPAPPDRTGPESPSA